MDFGGNEGERHKFFVSHVAEDSIWAEWVAWTIEASGYDITYPPWDFVAGSHRLYEFDRISRQQTKIIAIISKNSSASSEMARELHTALESDPIGAKRLLIAVCVDDTEPEGLLRSLVNVRIFGLDEESARRRLIAAASGKRAKPTDKPPFPGDSERGRPNGTHGSTGRPRFPGDLPKIDDSQVSDAFVGILDQTWKNLSESSFHHDVPDCMKLADYAYCWSGIRAQLLAQLRDGSYKPNSTQIVDKPKNRLHARPVARLNPVDRVLYDSIISYLAPRIDKLHPVNVRSDRWNPSKSWVKDPIVAWSRMRKALRRFHRRHPKQYMAYLDVASFFEHIDVDMLVSVLQNHIDDAWALTQIRKFLHGFSMQSGLGGLPQGPSLSGVLANIYLSSVDQYLRSEGLKFWRYSDDMYVFHTSEAQLRKIVLEVGKILRRRGLTLSAMKTEILFDEEIRARLDDSVKDAINYGLRVGNREAPKQLEELFDSGLASDTGRDVRYSLTRLGRINNSHAVAPILEKIGDFPHLTDAFTRYLKVFYGSDIEHRLLETLEESYFDSDPYSESHILLTLVRRCRKNERVRAAAWRILLDDERQDYVREIAARAIGRSSDANDADNLVTAFIRQPSPYIRRAILSALYETGGASLDHIHELGANDDGCTHLLQYLNSRPAHIPIP